MVSQEQLREMALAMPEAEERETWGECTFRVRDKIFLMFSPDGEKASVKATLDAQDVLVHADPETFGVAPYTGRFGWIAVQLASVDPDQMQMLVAEAWRKTAPKRLVAAFDTEQ